MSKNKAYLIKFEQALYYGSEMIVTATSEQEALDLVFEKVFNNQTVPADYQVKQLSRFSFLKKVGFMTFLKARQQVGIWHPHGF